MVQQISPLDFANAPIPAKAGIGLKFDHIAEIIETRPDVAWFEIHAENFMSRGGPALWSLEQIRQSYPISVHGVGMSLGGADPLSKDHLKRLKTLVDRIEPGLVSEHLAWCGRGGAFYNDLLALPMTAEALDVVCAHVGEVQDTLGRQILIENPAAYLGFETTDMSEPEFLNALCKRSGCGLLFDVNNVFVSSSNLEFEVTAYLDALEFSNIQEVHLAGHHVREVNGEILRIDDHGSPVKPEVWELYLTVLRQTGELPSLIEWDTNVPTLDVLVAEATKAQAYLDTLSLPEEQFHAATA
ncbi:DUF692 domain-containing protein [Sneathiella limimaris]|uniref:MNIO family bufferin maturase n=1 Tax=Sneathiella limimaris TaxID=1964213 RepID=UPI00146F4425|nr:DUF692 domain-containing protein [Sneathiella limimaris]